MDENTKQVVGPAQGKRWSHYRRHRVAPALTAVFILLAILCSNRAQSHTEQQAPDNQFVIAVFPEHFPPVYDISENGLPSGFGIDVMEAIARETHLTIRYSGASSWPKTMEMLASGEADLVPNMGITPPREKKFLFSVPYDTVPVAVFVHSTTSGINSFKDLANRRVGVVRANEGERLMDRKSGIILIRFDSLNELFVALIDKSVDAAVYPKSVFENLALRFNSYELIKQIEPPITVVQRAVGVNKEHAYLLESINPALKKLQASGELKKIYDHWFPPPPPFWSAKRVAITTALLTIIGIALLLFTRVRVLNKMNRLLVESNTFANAVLDASSECVLTVDAKGNIISANVTCEHILGRNEKEIRGVNLASLLEGVDVNKLLTGRDNNSHEQYQAHENYLVVHATDEKIPVRLTLSPMDIGSKRSFVITLHDERPALRAEQRAEYLTYHDPMTGMLNLRGIRNVLASFMQQQPPLRTCCLCAGLHRLKHINGLYGRQVGNQLLLQFSSTMRETMELQNINNYNTARISGERFLVVFPAPVDDDAIAVANELKKALSMIEIPIKGKKEILNIDSSVAVTYYPDHGQDADELIYNAEIALQHAEQNRTEHAYIFTAEDKLEESGYEQKLNRVRTALNHDRVELYFQPIKHMKTQSILHYEVLLRMCEADGTLIMPADIIPVAERFGLISRIDYRVLELTLTYLAALHDSHPDLKMAVNLSASHFGDQNLYGWFRQILEINSDVTSNLIFEITETSALQNFTYAQDFMQDLKSLGIDFSLDDFGVGFTSFAQLRSLPVDYVKIDGVFVRQILHNTEDQAIVTALTRVAHSLGKKVVAECIEDEDTYEFLRRIGVDYAQGYYIGRPSPELLFSSGNPDDNDKPVIAEQ